MLMVIPCGFRLPEELLLLVLVSGKLVVGEILCVATTNRPPINCVKQDELVCVYDASSRSDHLGY